MAGRYLDPLRLQLVAAEARHIPRIRRLLGADPTRELANQEQPPDSESG